MSTRLDWDYTGLASAYRCRPDYAVSALDECLRAAGIRRGMPACDVGAGTGNLTLALLRRGLSVTALEPNDDMRRVGIERTRAKPHVCWIKAVAESMPLGAGTVELIAFGSSFNVVERQRALDESARILKPGGWLVCVWNHRQLDDPLQRRIEALIRKAIPDYRYGTRRTDPSSVLASSGWFRGIRRIERSFLATMTSADVLAAWRSHLTLRRQAGEKLPAIVEAIRRLLPGAPEGTITVPYTTRLWMAQRSPARAGQSVSSGIPPGRELIAVAGDLSPRSAHAD